MIGGYILGSTTFDSILVGYYEGSDLVYARRIRNGFHASFAPDGILEFRGYVDLQMPVSESSRIRKGQMGRGPDGGGYEEMPLASAETGRGDRVP